MRPIALSPRLRMVAELVPQGARFADVGADHGYLSVWLLQQGTISHAVASDLRQGPLARARATAEKYGLTGQMAFRLCDGLSGIRPEEADTIAIAGMGGETIAQILACAPWTKGEGITLILQPMSSQPDLRVWLSRNGYAIKQECIVREGSTLYTTMLVTAGEMGPLTPAELWAGRQSAAPLRGELLETLSARVRRALEGQRAAVQQDEAALEYLGQVLEGLLEMKKEWETWQQ